MGEYRPLENNFKALFHRYEDKEFLRSNYWISIDSAEKQRKN